MGTPDEATGKADNEGMPRPYPGLPGATVEFWQWLATIADEDLLTLDEAAAMARIPVETFRHRRGLRGGGPKGFRMGKRVMFTKGHVRAWLNEMQAGAA